MARPRKTTITSNQDIINGFNADALKKLVLKLGLPRDLRRKDDLVDALDGYIRTNLAGFLDQLTPLEENLLAEAAYNRGKVDPRIFRARYGHPCPSTDRWSNRSASLVNLLIYPGTDGSVRVLPAMLPALQCLLNRPETESVKTTDTLPGRFSPVPRKWRETEPERAVHVFAGEATVPAELRRVLALVKGGGLKVTDKYRLPTAATVNKLSGALVLPDFALDPPDFWTDRRSAQAGPVRARAWAVLLQQCGWCGVKSGRLALSGTGKEILAECSPGLFRDGVNRFLKDGRFDELNRINNIRGQTGRARRHMTPPSHRRAAAGRAISRWPAGRWVDFEEAFRFMNASGCGWDVIMDPRYQYCLYFSDPHYGALGYCGESINRQYFRAFIMESLATLGLVDVAYVHPHGVWPELGDWWGIDEMFFCGRYDGLLYARITPLGAYCLGASATYRFPEPERRLLFRVLPNRDIALTGGSEPTPAERCTLEQMARKKSEFVWKIDRALLLQHLETGGAAGEAVSFLERHADGEIPDTVRTFLEDIESRAAAVKKVEKALLIEFDSEAAAALIAHDREAKKYCHPAGKRRLAVPEKHRRAFIRTARRLGYVLPP